MKKRILATLLTLVMVMGMLPFSAIAVEPDAEGIMPLAEGAHVHCLCGKTVSGTCTECGSEAVEWTATDAMPAKDAPGYYYLTGDVTAANLTYSSGEFALCLCGHTVNAGGSRSILLNTTLSITDCADAVGKLTGANGPVSVYGNTIRVDKNGVLNLYNGHITGNKTANDGIVYVNNGGQFFMYGGEISGNTVRRGTVYATPNAATEPLIHILGGTITGNVTTGTTNQIGGGGIFSFVPVEIGGEAVIYGNTAAAGFHDLYIRNDGTYTGKLVISTEEPLTGEAKVSYSLWNAEADLTDLQFVSGSPAAWDTSWLRYNDQKVGYADGKFFVDTNAAQDHIHCLCGKTVSGTCAECGSKAVEWNEVDSLSATSGYYALKGDVALTEQLVLQDGADLKLCLHGHTLTAASGTNHFDLKAGTKLTITDCGEGGIITGGSYTRGGAISVTDSKNVTIDIYGGQISGNTASQNAGGIYVAGSGSVINLHGGKICNNTATKIGGGLQVRAGAAMNMTGGEISDNNSVAGGGIATESVGTVLNISGGKIINNTQTGGAGGGGVYASRNTTFTLTGGEISGNTASTGGGIMCYAATAIFTGGKVTGNTTTGVGGGIRIYTATQIGGDLVVSGNTGSNNHDLCVTNDGTNAGALVVSADVPLTEGANINCTPRAAESDLTDLQFISGSPAAWDSSWLRYNGQKVGYADGKFFVDTNAPQEHIHCLCGKTVSGTCAECGSKAVEWTGTAAMPANGKSGYYYLTGDVSIPSTGYDSGEIAICLCGHSIISEAGDRILTLYSPLTITDCSENPGKITGATGKRTYGSTIRVDKGGVFNLYNGHITGNVAKDDGIVYLNGSSDANVAGGIFNMYGGEISGNTLRRGAVWVVPTGTNQAKARILGGTITGNTGSGTGTMKGAAGVYSFAPVEIGGEAKIYGNTSKEGGPDLFIRNDGSYTGKLVLSTEKPLTGAAKVNYSLWNAEADLTDLKYISGSPEVWNTAWLAYDGDAVQYKDGRFFTQAELVYSSHDHGGHQWVSMTNENGQVPSLAGYYVLDEDVTLTKQLQLASEVTLCLNGHTLTAASGTSHFSLSSGAKLTICDCAGGGVITGGSGEYGGAITASGGVELNLVGGTIRGNSVTKGGGGIYVNGKSAINLSGTVIRDNSAATWGGGIHFKGGATLNMTGGEISGNSAKIGAGVLMEGVDTTLNLSGGKINGNQAGTAGSGGVYASRNTIFNMTGGQINDNTAQASGGGMTLAGCKATLTGGEISGNQTTTSGGGIYICNSSGSYSDVVLDGVSITKNTAKTTGGGISMTTDGNSLTMNSGLVQENTAVSGGGILVQNASTFTLNDGLIMLNEADGGAGVYASTNSTFIMNGGKIAGNYARKNTGGVQVLRATAILNGGAITGNLAQSAVGGIDFAGSNGELNGTWITSNRCLEGSGAGVRLNHSTKTVSGKTVKIYSHVVMSGGLIGYNTTPKAVGGLLVQNQSVFDMYGGEIAYNSVEKFAGGVYVSTKASFNMHGGKIYNNTAATSVAGGIQFAGGSGYCTGGEIYGNTTSASAGGIQISGVDNKVTLKNMKIYDNTAKIGAGIVLQSKRAQLIMENCEIYNNKSEQDGAGVYVSNYVDFFATDCSFHDNVSQRNGAGLLVLSTADATLTNCVFENNQAPAGQGGAIWTRADSLIMDGCSFRGNIASDKGGALFSGIIGAARHGVFPHVVIDNAVFENNTSGDQGGAVYMTSGAKCKLNKVSFLNNTAAKEAGAIWAQDELAMYNVTATGNQSGGEGFAIYLGEAKYDGHSYIAGLMEISGDMQIHDNKGGDLYLGEETRMTVTAPGLAEGSKINMVFHSGLLTKLVWGAYNYEGSDQAYTLTYGTRSLTEPMFPAEEEAPVTEPTEEPTEAPTEAPTEPTEAPTEAEPEAPKSNTGWIVGIAAAVVAAAAAVTAALVSKKKKAAK